jgi:hypothetical protein
MPLPVGDAAASGDLQECGSFANCARSLFVRIIATRCRLFGLTSESVQSLSAKPRTMVVPCDELDERPLTKTGAFPGHVRHLPLTAQEHHSGRWRIAIKLLSPPKFAR